jgi:hypothetical protein
MPALSKAEHDEACRLGDERFKVLAGQVERRVRQCRPLMQETIERLSCMDGPGLESATRDDALHDQELSHNDQIAVSEGADIERASSVATVQGRGEA